MTVQKKILDLTGTQYLVQKITGEIPVKISDLQDDVTLGTHIADTDIHVTTADKTKWNNGVTQSYVFRYSSTALVASSTNSNTLLDNTDNLKVGDKVIDSDGVLFSITAIDTQNSTFTIGTALIDLAQDSDVVHKSGNETVAGLKTFENICLSNSIKAINLENQTIDLNNCYSSFGLPQSGNISFYFCNTNNGTANISNLPEQRAFFLISQGIRILSVGSVVYLKQTLVNSNGKTFVRYCNNSVWGSWRDVTNLVTTDTAQTISGNKTFSSNVNVYNSDSATDTANIILKNSKAERGVESPEQSINFIDKNNNLLAKINCNIDNNNCTRLYITVYDINNNSDGFFLRRTTSGTSIIPTTSSAMWLGNVSTPFYSVQTKKINTLEPSSLSLPGYSVSKIDISSYIADLTGGSNNYTAPSNGYVFVRTNNGTYLKLVEYPSGVISSVCSQTADDIGTFIPVLAGRTCIIQIKCSSIDRAYFIPCQGNI